MKLFRAKTGRPGMGSDSRNWAGRTVENTKGREEREKGRSAEAATHEIENEIAIGTGLGLGLGNRESGIERAKAILAVEADKRQSPL